MTKAKDFKLNDVVEWSSHGSYYTRKKRGVIVNVVPEGTVANSLFYLKRLIKKIGKFDTCALGWAGPRNHESYLVLDEEKTKGMFKIYWPRVKSLQRVKR